MANGKPIVTAYGTPRAAPLGWLDGRPPYVLFWPRVSERLAVVLREELGAIVHHGPDDPYFDYENEFTDGLWTGNIHDYAIIFHMSLGYFGPPDNRWYHEAPWQERIFDSWRGRYILICNSGMPNDPEWYRLGNQYARDQAIRVSLTITEENIASSAAYHPMNPARALARDVQHVGTQGSVVGVYAGDWLAATDASGEHPIISTRYVDGVEWIVVGSESILSNWLWVNWGLDNRPFMRNLWSVKREILVA